MVRTRLVFLHSHRVLVGESPWVSKRSLWPDGSPPWRSVLSDDDVEDRSGMLLAGNWNVFFSLLPGPESADGL